MESTFPALGKSLFEDLPDPLAAAMDSAVDLILHNQIVYSPELQRAYAVCRGGGMGMITSGEPSDRLCWRLCEQGFATDLAVQRQ